MGVSVEPQAVVDTFNETYFCSANSAAVRFALADLRSSILSPRDTAHYCYRGMESIRCHFLDADRLKKKDPWPAMRSALNVSEAWIGRTSKLAWPARHGQSVSLSSGQRDRLVDDLRALINRFLAYLKQGAIEALPEEEYPEL